MVGALGTNGFFQGSAFVFVRSGTTWTEQQKLVSSDGGIADQFGCSVALSGDTAVIGARRNNHTGLSIAGAAYVFVRNGTNWSEQEKLIASDAGEDDWFGYSVAVVNDTALVGASSEDPMDIRNAGSAYAFVRNGMTWTEQQKLIASDAAEFAGFGIAVALESDTAMVGAYGSNAAYLFARSGTSWAEQAKLTTEPGDGLGMALALSGDRAVIGASSGDSSTVPNSGAAYVFRLCPPPVTYCTAGTSARGCQAAISSAGTASASAPSGFSLKAGTVEGQKDGLFFFGTNGQQAIPWGNGTSYQCVVPPVTRGGLLTGSGTSGACDGSFQQDLNALWCPTCPKPGHNPGAGGTVQAQLWYRDSLSTSNQTTSFSDAIAFVVQP